MNASKSKRNPKSPTTAVRFPGITEDAKNLGVTRPHLWMCLVGQRKSKSLVARYQKLKGGRA
jgi:hypothetical protein